MGKNLYVGNLGYGVTDSDLSKMFEAHGTVESAQVIMDRDTGRSNVHERDYASPPRRIQVIASRGNLRKLRLSVENDSAPSFVNWVLERIAIREQQCRGQQFTAEQPISPPRRTDRPASATASEALWEGATNSL